MNPELDCVGRVGRFLVCVPLCVCVCPCACVFWTGPAPALFGFFGFFGWKLAAAPLATSTEHRNIFGFLRNSLAAGVAHLRPLQHPAVYIPCLPGDVFGLV